MGKTPYSNTRHKSKQTKPSYKWTRHVRKMYLQIGDKCTYKQTIPRYKYINRNRQNLPTNGQDMYGWKQETYVGTNRQDLPTKDKACMQDVHANRKHIQVQIDNTYVQMATTCMQDVHANRRHLYVQIDNTQIQMATTCIQSHKASVHANGRLF